MSKRRIWKLMSVVCRHEEFAAKLLANLRGTWRVLLVALIPAGKGGIRSFSGSPIPALAFGDLVRRRIGRRGEEEVLEKGLCPLRSWRKFTLSPRCATHARHTDIPV